MGQRKNSGSLPQQTPASTIEGRENQLISLAIDEAERLMREQKASSQIITHFLNLATVKAQKELELLELQKELVKAKTDNIKADRERGELYSLAINAMRKYSGMDDDDE